MKTRRTKPSKPALLHGGDLRARGWTARLIASYAPIPDATRKTRFGTVVKLWRPETIEAIEATPEFRAAHAEASRRNDSTIERCKRPEPFHRLRSHPKGFRDPTWGRRETRHLESSPGSRVP